MESIKYTAFTTPEGRFQFKRMPFGLVNAPSTFQQYMNHIFRKLIGISIIVYLDCIIIFSKILNEHINHIKQALDIITENFLKINFKKSFFASAEVKYLGFIVRKGEVSTDPDKTKVLDLIPQLNTQTQVRSFLGFINFYRRFIPNLAAKAKPIKTY